MKGKWTFLVLLLFGIPLGIARADGNDFIVVNLSLNHPGVIEARDYRVWIGAIDQPFNSFPDYTTGWLGLELDNQPWTYGRLFSQVGLMTDSLGIKWFVYSEAGVTCLRGITNSWNQDLGKYLRCDGIYNDLVTFGYLHKVELVDSAQGYWIARVEDFSGVAYDVARINSDKNVPFVINVVMEEGWTQSQDPFIRGTYLFWHPQYKNSPAGFTEWPLSHFGATSFLSSVPSSICPTRYGAILSWEYDPRYWYAGTRGTFCSADMFPVQTPYSNGFVVMKNY